MNYSTSKSTDKLAILCEVAKSIDPEVVKMIKSLSITWDEVGSDTICPNINIEFHDPKDRINLTKI